MKLFKSAPSTPAKAKEIVERFEAKLAEARAERQAAEDAYATAVVEAEESGSGPAIQAAEKARKALERARAAVEEAQTALAAGRQRKADADAAAAQAAAAAAWEATSAAAAARVAAAEAVAEAIGALAAALDKLQQASAAVEAACPVELDENAGITRPGTVAAVTRLEMVRAGMGWAAGSVFASEVYGLMSLADKVAESNAYVAKLRRQAGH